MNSSGRIALSSIAVSVGAATLLGIPEEAKSVDQTNGCLTGLACGLGWHTEYQGIEGMPPELPWWQQEQIQGWAEGIANEGSSYWAYGNCELRIYGDDILCGCAGVVNVLWARVDVYNGVAQMWPVWGHAYRFETDPYITGCRAD